MAKPNRLAAQREAEENVHVDDFDAQDYESASALEKLLTEAGMVAEDAKVHVYLIDVDSGDEPKIWSGTPDDYDLDALAKKFGSGKYRVKIYGPGDTGRYGVKANRVIPYRLSPEEDARLRAMRDGKPDPSSSQGITADMLAAAIKAAMPQQVVSAPQQNPVAIIKEMAEVFRAVMPPVQTAPQMNPLDVFKMAAELFRGRENADPIERGQNATGMDVFLKMIDKFAPMFEKTIAAQATQPVQLGNAAAVQPIQQPNQQQVAEEEMLRLRMGLMFLVSQAKADNDPATYASVVLDNVPEAELATMLAQPNWIDQLAKFLPEVKQHEEWFKELQEAVKEEIEARKKPAGGVDNADDPA